MKHTPFAEISRVADVRPVPFKSPMTRSERLERWAEALHREPDRLLNSIEELEWRPSAERLTMRADNSALAVAFNDPVLRADGLASDRLGDAMEFFRLSHTEAHITLCSCIYGQQLQAGVAAQRVRSLTRPDLMRPDLGMLWIAGAGLAGTIALSALLQLIY